MNTSAENSTQGSVSPQTSGPSLYAWAVVGLLFPVAMLNYLDRMMVATMRSSIRLDIPSIASDQDFGLLMAIFMWVYACLSPVGGYIADRFNRRWMVIISLFVWSLMTWLTGHTHTFTQMAWVRGLMGVSEAFYMPAALTLIAEFHPGPTRSRAIGIHMCGIYLGQALGGLGGHIADTSSWRNAFTGFGMTGIAYAILLLLTLRDSPKLRDPARDESATIKGTLLALLTTGSFFILVIHFTLPAMPGWVIKNWLPTFLAAQFNLKQGSAGMSATGYVTMGMFAGALFGGVLADFLMRRTQRGRIYASALSMAFCAPALVGLGYALSLNSAIVFMILFGIGFGMFDANNMPILCQIARPEHRATGYGIMNFVSIGIGAGVTVGMGALRDHGVSIGPVFVASALISAFSGLLLLLIKPKTF